MQMTFFFPGYTGSQGTDRQRLSKGSSVSPLAVAHLRFGVVTDPVLF
jgi:hypothetical protein